MQQSYFNYKLISCKSTSKKCGREEDESVISTPSDNHSMCEYTVAKSSAKQLEQELRTSIEEQPPKKKSTFQIL
jgi:hypothetical protein